MTDLTPEKRAELRKEWEAAVPQCIHRELVLSLLDALDAKDAEMACVDRALGIPPGREPRRLELLAKLRGHFCEPCGGTGFYQGPRLGDEKCPSCDGFGVPR